MSGSKKSQWEENKIKETWNNGIFFLENDKRIIRRGFRSR